MFKIVFINIWMIFLSIVFLVMNGTMESYIHFDPTQSAFTPEDFLLYFALIFGILALLLVLFYILVTRTKLIESHAKIVFMEFKFFSFSWVIFSLNLVISYFIIPVEYPLGIIYYIVQIAALGFLFYRLLKTDYKDLLTISE